MTYRQHLPACAAALGQLVALTSCGSEPDRLSYEATCRQHVAAAHPRLEPTLDKAETTTSDDEIETVTLTVSDPRSSGSLARCDIPRGTRDVVASGVRRRD